MRQRLWAGWVALGTALLLSCGSSDKTGLIYLVGQSDQSVGTYKLNLKTGVLNQKNNAIAPIGTPAKTGTQPTVLIFDPGKSFAYVIDKGSNDIASFSLNHDGLLAAGSTTMLQQATNPGALAMDPGGKFLFVADQGIPGDPNCGPKGPNPSQCMAGVSVFTVNSGTLTAVAFKLSTSGAKVACDPTKEACQFLFPLLNDQQAATYSAPVVPAGIVVSNSGNYVYVTDQANNIVVGFSFDTSSGILTSLPSLPLVVGSSPSGLFSPTIGNFLYETNAVSNNIYEFKIEPDGSLTLVTGSPVSAGVGPTVMISDPNAKYLFAIGNGSNQLLGYRINQVTGELTPLTPPSISTGDGPVAVTIRSNGVVNGDYWILVSDNRAFAVTTVQFINNTGSMSVLPQLTAPPGPYGIGSR